MQTISATKTIYFGDVMKQARIAPVIVERGGKAEVVVISKKSMTNSLPQARTPIYKSDWMACKPESVWNWVCAHCPTLLK